MLHQYQVNPKTENVIDISISKV